MTLLKTALKNIRKNLVINIICLIQLTAVLLITAFMTSTMCIRYQTYSPLKNVLESKGFYAQYGSGIAGAVKPGGDPMSDWLYSAEELCGYVNADSAVIIREQWLQYEAVGNVADTLFYGSDLIRRYSPGLKRGRWLSADPDELEMVIPDNFYGLDVGDDIEFTLYSSSKEAFAAKAKVVGVMEDNANVLGKTNSRDTTGDTHRYFYRRLNELQSPVVLTSKDALERFYPQGAELLSFDMVFFMYDDISDEELSDAMLAAGDTNVRITLRLDNINQNSRDYLKNELLKLLPITAVLLILVIISSISVSAIAARSRLKDYAKYYVLGLEWRRCVMVNFFQALVIAAASLVLACAGLIVIGGTALAETFMIIWNAPLFISLFAVLALYLAFSMIMPMFMLRSVSPKALLQAE